MGTRKITKGEVGARVASSVRLARENNGWSQVELSGRLAAVGRPMQATAISKIEAGDRRVDVDDLVALAAALELEPDQLLSGDVVDARSRTFLAHEEELRPVLDEARAAKDRTGLGYRSIAAYVRLAGSFLDTLGEYQASKKETGRG